MCQAILNVWEAWCQEQPTGLRAAARNLPAVTNDGTKNRFHLNSHEQETGIGIDDRHRANNRDRQRLVRQNKKIRQLEDQLKTLREKHETSKTVGGILSVEWIVRVMLASANTSSRALVQTFREAAGSDSGRVSRESIGRIRAAFVELWKSMHVTILTQVFSTQHSAVEAAHRVGPAHGSPGQARSGPKPAHSGPGPALFLSVSLTHVQER